MVLIDNNWYRLILLITDHKSKILKYNMKYLK